MNANTRLGAVLSREPVRLAGLFLAARLVLFMALPLEGLRGYGDFVHFFRLAGMGRPFIDYWVEFPPVFPHLSALLYLLASGQQHVFDQLHALIMTLFQAGEVAVFTHLIYRVFPEPDAQKRAWIYFSLLLVLAYGWWYFDPVASFLMLLGMCWALEDRRLHASIALGLGALTKLFPLLALPALWRLRPGRSALQITLASLGLTACVYGALWLASPEMTRASLISQGSKGSWETVWALIDGNLNTGNFGPESERNNPALAAQPRGNPARFPAWATLPVFAAIGGWFFWKVRINNTRQLFAFLGITWCVFLLWTPGWSPQWVLYLLPVLLIALPLKEALLFSLTLISINLLEWPVLLSRGFDWGLWMTVPVRTLLFMLMIWEYWKILKHSEQP